MFLGINIVVLRARYRIMTESQVIYIHKQRNLCFVQVLTIYVVHYPDSDGCYKIYTNNNNNNNNNRLFP
jgi:hypothetical protein